MTTSWSWFVVQVEPGWEFKARSNILDDASLEAQGMAEDDLHVLIPVRHVLRMRPRRAADRRVRRSLVAVPRLPGYLLMGVQPPARPVWGYVLGMPHVTAMLGRVADQPIVIAMLADLVTLGRRRRRNKGGIEVANGPYESMMAHVVEITGGDPEVWLDRNLQITDQSARTIA